MTYLATKRVTVKQNKKFGSKNKIALRRRIAYHPNLSIFPPITSSQNVCACGCGKELSKTTREKFRRGHMKNTIKKIPCECGCGTVIDSL